MLQVELLLLAAMLLLLLALLASFRQKGRCGNDDIAKSLTHVTEGKKVRVRKEMMPRCRTCK